MDITNMDVEKLYHKTKFMNNFHYYKSWTAKVVSVAVPAIITFAGVELTAKAAQIVGHQELVNTISLGVSLATIFLTSGQIPFQLSEKKYSYIKEKESADTLNETMKKISENNNNTDDLTWELRKIGISYGNKEGWVFPEELSKKRYDELKTAFIQIYENKREAFETRSISHKIHALMETLTTNNSPMDRIFLDMAKVGIELTDAGLRPTSSKPEIRDLQNQLLQRYNQVKTSIAKDAKDEVKIIEKAYAIKIALSDPKKDPGEQLSAMKALGITGNPVTGLNVKCQGSPTLIESLQNVVSNYEEARNRYMQAVPNTRADPGMQIRLKKP